MKAGEGVIIDKDGERRLSREWPLPATLTLTVHTEATMDRNYRDPRRMIRRLRDGLSAELAGLNEDNAIEALRYAEDRLGNELAMVRLVLELQEEPDDGDTR